jgi:hypothetical protein
VVTTCWVVDDRASPSRSRRTRLVTGSYLLCTGPAHDVLGDPQLDTASPHGVAPGIVDQVIPALGVPLDGGEVDGVDRAGDREADPLDCLQVDQLRAARCRRSVPARCRPPPPGRSGRPARAAVLAVARSRREAASSPSPPDVVVTPTALVSSPSETEGTLATGVPSKNLAVAAVTSAPSIRPRQDSG